ncbi:MAG: hypothetical protein R3F29_11230 [Planctomycetota bacterium]
MTEHDVEEREQVDARLLEVLLVERFGGRGEALHDDAQVGAPVRRARRAFWLAAAVLLLGVGVVTAIALSERPAATTTRLPRLATQDPAGPEVVPVKSREQFLQLLAEVERIELVRYDNIGAHLVVDDKGSSDTLDMAPWPERAIVDGERVEAWRQALRQNLERPEAAPNGIADSYNLVLALRDRREVHCYLSWGADVTQLWLGDGVSVQPRGELSMFLTEAIVDITRRHLRARGTVTEVADFARYADPVRFDVPAALLPELPPRDGLRDLRVQGTPDVAGWQRVARLQQLERFELARATIGDVALSAILAMRDLRELRLRDCTDLDIEVLARLGQARRLQLLHVTDLSLGAGDAALDALASLPMLREFGLRFVDEPTAAGVLAPLQRTKLERLLLVDVPVDLDLAPLRQLPSLRELVVVGPLDDAALEPLRQMRSLRRLTLRNCRLTEHGAAALHEALPDCALDWLPNQRWFDTGHAFDYAPK